MSRKKASEIELAERDRQIIAKRRAGTGVHDLAREFGLSASSISHIVNRRLAEALRLRDSESDLLRQQELERIDAVQAAAWAPAMAGDIDSLKIVLAAIDRRCKLMGLDAPQQLEVISIGAVEAEIRRIEQQLAVVDSEVIRDEQLELPAD